MFEVSGDLFSTPIPVIGHGVNIRGFMGAGVAKLVKDKFPEAFEEYRDLCATESLLTGECQFVPVGDRLIINMATQDDPGPNADYTWLFSCAIEALGMVKSLGQPYIAIPRIGAGIGGLDWDIVKSLLIATERIVEDVYFVVYTLEDN